MTICEGCLQEKDVTDIEGNLLCGECAKDVVRCDFCNKFLAINYDDLDTNLGGLSVPELTLPGIQGSRRFCDVDCLEKGIKKYKKEIEEHGSYVDTGSDISMEKLFDKWVLYLQKLDTFHKGFEVFTNESEKSSVKELRDIVRGIRGNMEDKDILGEKTDELRDYNEDVAYQMFRSTLRTFLSDEGVSEDNVGEEEKFREEFDGYLRWNIEKLFDFPVLLMEAKRYEVDFNGVNNEINFNDSEQLKFRNKALEYISEKQLDEILVNTWDGTGFFGLIANGSDIIKAIKDKKKTVYSDEIIIGIHDGFNGSGYFKRVNASKINRNDNDNKDDARKEFGIDLDDAELDWGKYCIGTVFGNVEWKYN